MLLRGLPKAHLKRYLGKFLKAKFLGYGILEGHLGSYVEPTCGTI